MRAVSRQGGDNHAALTLTTPSLGAKQRPMMRVLGCVAALVLALGLSACATRGEVEANRTAQEDAHKAEDDASCRAANTKPGETAYDACRQDLATKRAKKAVIDYQKARDFDRVLGGLDDL